MDNIEFALDSFRAVTYVKGNDRPVVLTSPVPAFAPGESVSLLSHDEIPCFLAEKGKFLAGFVVDQEAALSGSKKEEISRFLNEMKAELKKVEVYFAPCLTFSHIIVSEEEIEGAMEQGYQPACKRTDGSDFLDVPLILLMQLRSLGIPMENIHLSRFDTSENPSLLYSSLNGDREYNLTVATLN